MRRAWALAGVLLAVACSSTEQTPRTEQTPPAGERATADTQPPERQAECVKATCEGVSRTCGEIDDGCGNVLRCGQCAAGETCEAGACAPATTCTPKSCAELGASCGNVPDGCGGVIKCGGCAEGQSCGASGQANRCGAGACTPKTCTELAASCGVASDGCGGVIQCGTCGAAQACTQNKCVAQAPAVEPGSTRWFRDIAVEASALDVDAAGNLYTSEDSPTEYGMPPIVYRKLRPDGTELAKTEPYWRPHGFSVSPLGNLFMVMNSCFDAPTGECTSLQKVTVGGSTAWKRDIPYLISWRPAVDTHGSAWIVDRLAQPDWWDERLKKYAWDGALVVEKKLNVTPDVWLATDSSDAVIIAARGSGQNALDGVDASYVAGGGWFVMKLDAAGNFVWLRRVGDALMRMTHLDTTNAGTIVFGGGVRGQLDWNGAHSTTEDESYLFVLEANGTPRFAKSLTDAHPFDTWVGGVDKQGRALVIGAEYDSTPKRGHLMSYNLDGTLRWQRDFNGALIEAVVVSPDRSVVASGLYWGSTDFGLGAKTAPKDRAGFLMRLNQ